MPADACRKVRHIWFWLPLPIWRYVFIVIEANSLLHCTALQEGGRADAEQTAAAAAEPDHTAVLAALAAAAAASAEPGYDAAAAAAGSGGGSARARAGRSGSGRNSAAAAAAAAAAADDEDIGEEPTVRHLALHLVNGRARATCFRACRLVYLQALCTLCCCLVLHAELAREYLPAYCLHFTHCLPACLLT